MGLVQYSRVTVIRRIKQLLLAAASEEGATRSTCLQASRRLSTAHLAMNDLTARIDEPLIALLDAGTLAVLVDLVQVAQLDVVKLLVISSNYRLIGTVTVKRSTDLENSFPEASGGASCHPTGIHHARVRI